MKAQLGAWDGDLMSGQLTSRHSLIHAFDDIIVNGRNKDTAEALTGFANALATMELARQLRVQNLLALASQSGADTLVKVRAQSAAEAELLDGYTYEEWLAQQPARPQQPPRPAPYAS